MGKIASAHAYANNEVAYLAWDIDGKIEGCLGFEVVRIYLEPDGSVSLRDDGEEDRVPCAAWVGFKGQRNPHWLPQTTSIWPVQKLSWRDLTLRKRRNRAQLRPSEISVRYEIRPLGDWRPGLEPAPDPVPETVAVAKRGADGRPVLDADDRSVKIEAKAYDGKPRPLGYLGPAVATNAIRVTRWIGPFQSTFTNGVLAAQWLRNVIWEDGVKRPNELMGMISDPKNGIRKYLAGDVLPMLRELFEQAGSFLLALYELDDNELVDLLLANKNRIRLILANTGLVEGEWDVRNSHARQALIDANVDIQHRMFNNSTHIGHNKFVVHLDDDDAPVAVFTGSTNWTTTGLAGQTNNAIIIEDRNVAKAFADCWHRMLNDPLDLPTEFDDGMPDNQQGAPFRTSNETPARFTLDNGAKLEVWFSPNMPARRKSSAIPPDLREIYRLMRKAEQAILFLAFYPGQSGKDCIVGEAIEIGRTDQRLIVSGAVSSAQAMPNYVPGRKNDRNDPEDDEEAVSPHTFTEANVSIVRASRLDDRDLLSDFGGEELTAKGGIGAIIHDKVVVIDPLSDDCAVIFGSHNLGFKASYSNDENLVIVRGDKALAAAYAVHVLDVYDHYRFRAIEAELRRQGKKGWSGFLATEDTWLDPYADGAKGALMRYFARG
ncbi:phosphatidylserine/phosphatidylglycerophosphate/cardiolipin synthase-like enzyme [Rhizobium sp. PP-F2F-G48]|uniref:phospholipase D-like domain-containing protein n=1 Tax=Rhizobium sp. PP-F2F-G48 TaxID=2135651 RepID=UPI0010538964|nr:phospholipase D-like domain-containing protein [Rhizobium sp. PP-F2F-G48]TCM51132.1 phosphatidylserine/phosphatidylglycerophosphate/cardiolipin synthase-like enzyme [Rhizobium sp. PP-F2F-G48]